MGTSAEPRDGLPLRRWLAALLVLLALPTFAGCGAAADGPIPRAKVESAEAATPATGPTTERIDRQAVQGEVVFFTGSSTVEAKITRKLVARFERKYPDIDVKFTAINRDYPTVLLTRFAGGAAPDVFAIDGKFFQDWAGKGLLLPLDGYLEAEGVDTSRFRGPLFKAAKAPNGTTYGIPINYSNVALFTNDKLLREAGVQPPRTWEELEHAAMAVSKRGGTGGPVGLCLIPAWERMLLFALQQGGGITDPEGRRMIVRTRETKRAVEWVRAQLDSGAATSPEMVGAQWCGDAFGRGDVAMALEGAWMLPPLRRQYPETKFSVHPLPVGERAATLAYSGNLGIARTSKNPDAAWLLLDFLASPESQAELAAVGLAVPALTGVEYPKDLEPFAAGLDHATVWSLPPGFFNTVLITADNEMSAVLEGKQTMDGMLREIEHIGEQLLPEQEGA